MHSETDSPQSAQTQENLHGLGRKTQEEDFQNTSCSSQSLFSSSVISLAVLCRELAQSLPTSASSTPSPGCPCWGLQSFRPLTDPGAPPAWRHGWEFQQPLLLCAWVSLPLWGELERQHGLDTWQALPALLKGNLAVPSARRGSWCPQGHFPRACQQPRPLKAAGLDLAIWS